MGKLVIYHNDINKIPLRNFNEKELNVFFSILFQMKDLNTDTKEFKFLELKKLSKNGREDKRLVVALENMFDKLIALNLKIVLKNEITWFTLFRTLKINEEEKTVKVSINEDFKYMLNDLFEHFTQFELEQLVNFKSSYTKNIFRLLKQFESTKLFIKDFEEFKEILCVPETYKAGKIDERVFKPAMAELLPIFPNLKLEKIKKGKRIDQIKFTWGNRCSLENKEDQPVVEVKISEQLNKIIEKAKKNRFLQPLLTVSNIEKLIKKYPEDLLIKGLNFAVQEINYEVKSLSYLEKTIDTGIENSKKKIVVEKIQSKQEIKKEEKQDQPEGSNVDTKFTISPVEGLKAEIAKWCMKNKRYPLFGELEDISSLREIGKFLEKYNIEI